MYGLYSAFRFEMPSGEMVEWSITAVLKTAVPRGTGGSNPSLSANSRNSMSYGYFFDYDRDLIFCFDTVL